VGLGGLGARGEAQRWVCAPWCPGTFEGGVGLVLNVVSGHRAPGVVLRVSAWCVEWVQLRWWWLMRWLC